MLDRRMPRVPDRVTRHVPPQPRIALDVLSLDEAIQMALAANPRLAAFSQEIDAASGRLEQAGLWPNPNLEVGTEEGPANRALGFGGDNKIAATIWQPLPISGRIGAQKTVAKREREVIRLLYEQQRRSLVSAVHGAFYGALGRERALEIATVSRGIARELYEGADDRVSQGAAPETERIRAEIELGQAEAALAEAQAAMGIARQELFTLLGDAEMQVATLQGALREEFPAVVPEAIRSAALKDYPALEASRKDVDRARAELVLARAEWFADPEIGIGVGRLREDREDEVVLEWGISIPLPLFDRNQGKISERRALVRRSERIHDATRIEVLHRLNIALAEHERFRTQATEYRDRIIPRAERAIDLVREGYQQGKLSQLDLLDTQRTLAASRQTYVGLLEDLHRVGATMEELGGRPLSEFEKR
ncbi:MAG: TolC family protein [Planctomycetota bacterium]|nr:TolC family protein [Planctomycetota bacterium]